MTGKKGNIEPGYVYLYINHVQTTPVIVEGNFAPRMLLKSRYSVVVSNEGFFQKISSKVKKEINRIYSDLDPYGEEDWEE